MAVVLLLGSVALVGCGSSGGGAAYVPPKGPAVDTVTIKGDHFAFVPDKVQVPAGIIDFKLHAIDTQHSFVIEGIPGFQIEAASGQTASKKIKLEKGKYTFYCNIPGHRAAGMEGTLTVG